MAKVKIQGHVSGSGVFTVTAPNSNTDRTLTLPDNTGALLTNSDSLPAANLTGTVADARFPSTLTAASAANLTAIPAAQVTGTLPASVLDTTTIENNIAMLGFYRATDHSRVKYSLVDQVIDDYNDASGIDASNSTNETLTSGVYAGGGTTPNNKAIAKVTIKLTNQYYYCTGTEYFDYSDNGSSWTTLDSGTNKIADAVDTAFITTNQSESHRYWRVRSTANANEWSIKEATMLSYNGSAYSSDLTGSGTALQSSNSSGSPVARAFDNNDSTAWASATATNAWFGYDFGTSTTYQNLTLQSNANTASTAPTTGDIVILVENAAGTATINTDVKAFISRNGTAFSSAVTLVDEGSWGTNKRILAAHSVDLSGITSGTAIKYKITTLNQSSSKSTKIHATSLAWA